MQITLHDNGIISINGQRTHYVSQELRGTVVRDLVSPKIVTMPHNRYALSCDVPASGVPGRKQFEADLTAIFLASLAPE